MGFKGVDVRQFGDRVVIRASLKDSSGVKLTTGTASLYLYELQSDGTLKSYDFSSNTFKTTALTTETQALTHRTGNNSTTNTGIWTYALTTVSGFTRGNIYIAQVSHSSASPPQQEREFQYGEGEGDLTVNSTGEAQADVARWNGTAVVALGDPGGVPVLDASGYVLSAGEVASLQQTLLLGEIATVGAATDGTHFTIPSPGFSLLNSVVYVLNGTYAKARAVVIAEEVVSSDTNLTLDRTLGGTLAATSDNVIFFPAQANSHDSAALPSNSAGVNTLLTRVTAAVALASGVQLSAQGKTDVQTAMTSQGYTTTRAGKLDFLDAAISSLNNLSAIAAIKTKTDQLTFTTANKVDASLAATPPTAAAIRTEIDSNSTQLAAIKTDTGNLITRIPSALFTGITSLANWLRGIARSGNIDATTTTEINATTGSGTGTYDPTADSNQAIRDRGDAAWTTGSGSSGGAAGSGADSCTITITNSATSLPIADADVWVTSDSAGTAVIAGTLQTNSNGQATFLLDAGTTVYLWMQKDGENSILGDPFVVVAD